MFLKQFATVIFFIFNHVSSPCDEHNNGMCEFSLWKFEIKNKSSLDKGLCVELNRTGNFR
jgi:hypothetical protein